MQKSDTLKNALEQAFLNPQPSERWAMYRLIAPLVDHANDSLGLLPFYEFNQTSEHGTHQSVDIALLDSTDDPVVLIEAKRADRPVSPEQIDKYLSGELRGVVSNGFVWVLCNAHIHEALHLWVDNELNDEAFNKVVEYIRGDYQLQGKENGPLTVYRSQIRPKRVTKSQRASRKSHTVTATSSASDFAAFISAVSRPDLESTLLRAIAQGFEQERAPQHLRIETRKTRVSFFDERRPKAASRIARIELGKQQPDLLVRTEVVETNPALSEVASPTIHDKGPHMRRFRLGTIEQSERFGTLLSATLRAVTEES